MIRLLISVRDAAEARDCLAAGVDLIDIKEPLRGSLGAADPSVVSEICELVHGTVPLSAALGELVDEQDLWRPSAARPLDGLAGLSYAKVGLANAAALSDWSVRCRSFFERLPPGVSPVGVAYADWRSAASPTPWQVLEESKGWRAKAVLIDTWDKRSGNVLDAIEPAELADFVAAIKGAGLFAVVGGSVSLESLPQIVQMEPNYVAVRGAVCGRQRTGRVELARVRLFVSRLQELCGRPSQEPGHTAQESVTMSDYLRR